MTLHAVGRRTGATLVAIGAVVVLLWLASPASADPSEMVFTGGGYGPTAAVAIQSAIDDAATSASAYGLFNCTVVGAPQVFARPNDPFGRFFRAMADVSCT
jgi:hypothetical protein